MNTKFKPHPDGIKSYIGHDRLTGLYSVRIGWTIYAANANGNVLYTVKGEVKTPLNVENFKAKRPKVYASLMNEISFQRKKALAITLQLNNIPSYERKRHKRRMGMVGSR
ncbi:hypothetical protein NQ776_06445 [Acinetobacter baumannii]|nr:hypothetical protein [Acinetobacter baumannii]MDV7600392.1 hypothetical protein [Acinetobacter baumannii]